MKKKQKKKLPDPNLFLGRICILKALRLIRGRELLDVPHFMILGVPDNFNFIVSDNATRKFLIKKTEVIIL